MKLKDPNFSPLESCWIIEKKKKLKATLLYSDTHIEVSEGEGREEKKGKNRVLGDKTDGKNSLFETGYLGYRILWQIVLIPKGTFHTSFLCCFLLPTQKDLCQH